MAYLSVADLITGPARLSPAEAAGLTLAVARKLDEEGVDGHGPGLPDDNGILISSTGTIAFVRGPEAPVPDTRTALSALLMRLLRLDDEGPRTHVPGGLLIVLARNLGYIQLPPTSGDAFRVALERFATSDPTVIAGIFWRAARLKAGGTRRTVPGSAEATPSVERRRGGPTRAELRRALREIERELYDTRNRLARKANRARPAASSRPEISMGGMLRRAGIAAGVVLLASIAAWSGTRSARPATGPPASAATRTDASRIVPVASAETASVRPRLVPAVTVSSAPPPVTRRAPGTPAKAISPRPPRRAGRPVTPDATATRFAGGARQIAWTIQQ